MTYEFDDLSAFLDQELTPSEQAGVEQVLSEQFGAQVQFRNLEAVSKATQNLGYPVDMPSPDFADAIFNAIEDLEMETVDFEEISTFVDQEMPAADLDILADSLETNAVYSETVQNIKSLSQALQNLSTPESSTEFVAGVMDKIEALSEAIPFESLSAHHDQALHRDEVTALKSRLEHDVDAQTQLENCQILSTGMQRLSAFSPSDDFEANLWAALEAEVMTPDLESLSAHYDEQKILEASELNAEAHQILGQFARLSDQMQALPDFEASDGFFAQLQAEINQDMVDFDAVSAHFDQEEVLDSASLTGDAHLQLDNMRTLSQAMANLPTYEASEHFLDGIFEAIEAETPDFETLSAHFDGELETAVDTSHPAYQNIETISQGFQHLPEYEANADFLSQLEAKLPQEKAKVFALPFLMRHRYARMVAGFALFGMLALMSKNLIVPGGPQTLPSVVAVNINGEDIMVPTTHVIHNVEYSAADALFSEVDDSLENFAENDYTDLIGG